MNRKLSAAVVICIGMSCVLAVGAPSLYVAEPEIHFGTVIEGTPVRTSFSLENRGDEDLVIDRVSAGCGCTTTALATNTLIPRRVVPLNVVFNTTGYRGQIVMRITVRSNDPDQPQVHLTLRGTVVPSEPYLMEARELSSMLHLLFDVRDPVQYSESHLLGAMNLPADEATNWFPYLPKAFPIILYDQAGEQAPAVAQAMLAAGFTDVRVILGGLDEWLRLYGDRMVTTLDVSVVPLHLYVDEDSSDDDG